MTQPPPRQEFTEEEIRQIEAEMDKLRVDDVLLQTLVTLINLGARKAGLATPPGEEPPARDLPETKQAIDGARALFALLEPNHGEQLAPIKDALSRLQMAYVQLSGGAPEVSESAPEPDKPEGPGPAQSSGRLWVPGQ
ncbi:hypothetical protein DVA67_010500 [Solirubrobacter sp. CPCC 204708]|uniref:DUF1844 domain-containing protein n=1 Tax=Solirubrobacter deserti TaxID=2282478 RepID=A0ABT4RVA6_9ACTN|nr:hypothetical protein [Solirubrobacter deserti]MBE2316408.1 hypothetical protein [Solirubrobacter deserti]MDA0142514.1 hypothetical protein [Solirubrobacter deserti]